MNKKRYAMLTKFLGETPELLYQIIGMKDAPKKKRVMMFEMMAVAMEQEGLPKEFVSVLRSLQEDEIYEKVLADFA